MSLTMFSVGRDTQLVVIGPAGRIDLTHVTSFESRQITHSVRVDRLDGTHMGTELPKGWEGSFEIERGNSTVDDFVAAAEQEYFSGKDHRGDDVPVRDRAGRVHLDLPVRHGHIPPQQRRRLEGRQQRAPEARVLRRPEAAHLMTPSASIIASATTSETVVDGEGRRLTVRRMTALDRLRLFKAAGPLLAQNQPWLGMALIASSVASIDEVPVPPPVNEAQIEAMVSRLGDAGIAATAAVLQQFAEPAAAELVDNAGN